MQRFINVFSLLFMAQISVASLTFEVNSYKDTTDSNADTSEGSMHPRSSDSWGKVLPQFTGSSASNNNNYSYAGSITTFEILKIAIDHKKQ